jgi:hypothetical protein
LFVRKKLDPPKPVIFLDDISSSSIIILQSKEKLIVYDYLTKKEYFREVSDKYRIIVFNKCVECKITTISKLLSLFFIDCKEIQLCINSDIIGALSFLRCKNSNLSIRQPIGYLEISLSYNLTIHQRLDKLLYIILSCIDIYVKLKNTERQFPNNIFGDRVFIYIEDDKIERWVSNYYLNSIQVSVKE